MDSILQELMQNAQKEMPILNISWEIFTKMAKM